MRHRGVAATAAALAALAFAGAAQAAEIPPLADIVVAPDGPTRATSIHAVWVVAPEGVPGTTVRWDLCPADVAPIPGARNGCGSERASDEPLTTTVPTPNEGAHALWAWYEDEEGNQGPPIARQVMIDRTAPKAPTDIRWVDGRVTWTSPVDGGAPATRVHWKFCRGWRGFTEQCLAGVGPAQQPFPLALDLAPLDTPPTSCVGNQWTALFWLEDAAGNIDRDPRSAGGIGGGVDPSCAPQPKDPPAKPRTKTRLTIGGRLRAVGRGAKRRKRVTLTATAKPANAEGVVRFTVKGKQGKRTLTRTGSVRLAKGRASYALTVPKGFRRLSVKATYTGSKTHVPSSRGTTVRIP